VTSAGVRSLTRQLQPLLRGLGKVIGTRGRESRYCLPNELMVGVPNSLLCGFEEAQVGGVPERPWSQGINATPALIGFGPIGRVLRGTVFGAQQRASRRAAR
jgi:hypothetical protein